MTPKPETMWSRCAVLPARVERTTNQLVFLSLPEPFRKATTRKAEGFCPAVGDAIEVAGHDFGLFEDLSRQDFRVLLVKSGGPPLLVGDPAAFPGVLPPPAPPPRPAWIGALRRHGLISRWAAWFSVEPRHHDLPPVMLIAHLHPTPGNVKRGYVQYDWKWGNDTADPVADFAALVRCPGVFKLQSIDSDEEELTFTARGAPAPIVVEAIAGDLDALAAAMNAELARLGHPRRLYEWATGSDSIAFLGRTPAEVEALRAEVPVGDLELCE